MSNYKSKAEIKAEQQAQQGRSSNTATLDRPITEEVKTIFLDSMTGAYDACHEARNKGISAGIAKFRAEVSTGDRDFFADWEIEAEQILEARISNLSALPECTDSIKDLALDLSNLEQYPLELLRDRNHYLADLPSLDADQERELDALYSFLAPRLEASNPDPA